MGNMAYVVYFACLMTRVIVQVIWTLTVNPMACHYYDVKQL